MTRFHGPNVVIYEVVSGGKSTTLIGSYLLPSTLKHLPNLEEYLFSFMYQDPIIMEYLKVDIGQAQNSQIQKVSDHLMEFVVVDILRNFRQFLHSPYSSR